MGNVVAQGEHRNPYKLLGKYKCESAKIASRHSVMPVSSTYGQRCNWTRIVLLNGFAGRLC